ncbi:hypothetical protein [Cyclobacterium salsum]|uniref:hypothetical protein n=1 Tax=Cyclobacterium salsum TaxID=2666329 RepID=UPI001390CC6E|nr:hypothetical protein [Cyclobacterium salsum]
MFRKTPSEGKLLFTEIKKEFGTLYENGKNNLGKMLDKYPRHSFGAMVGILLLSASLAFIISPRMGINQQKETPQLFEEVKGLGSGMADEVSALFKIHDEAKRIGQLKNEVERIISKDQIDFQDSIFLENAIPELERYHQSKSTDHED